MRLEIGTVLYRRNLSYSGLETLARYVVKRHTKTQAVASLEDGTGRASIARFPIEVPDKEKIYAIGEGYSSPFRVATPELDEKFEKQQLSAKLSRVDYASLSVERLREIEKIVGDAS